MVEYFSFVCSLLQCAMILQLYYWKEQSEYRAVCRVTMRKGDIPLSAYKGKQFDDNTEFLVEEILDERRRGAKVQYRVKWKVGTAQTPQQRFIMVSVVFN